MLTIAQRRALSSRALEDPEFRGLLVRDPAGALAKMFGRILPPDEAIMVVEETASRWAFILPEIGSIEETLPDPTDPRSHVENQVYALLREEPEVVELAARDPRQFLSERFDVQVRGIDMRRESPGTTFLVVPHAGGREELSDEMLDLIVGGGEPSAGAKLG